MLTTREVADKLKANPGTIRMWCINGTFPNAKQEDTPRGPVWLIPETDLRGFTRRGRGRPDQFGIYNLSYNRAAASSEWADMSTDERIGLLISEIEKENIEKNAQLYLPESPEERRDYARRILARFEKQREKARAGDQESIPIMPPKLRSKKTSKRRTRKPKADRRKQQ